MNPRRKKLLKNIGLGFLIVGVPLGLTFVRCYMVRHADGHARASSIEETASGEVLRLVDEICTGDSSKGAGGTDCDLRTITVSLPDGSKLDTSMSEGFAIHHGMCSGEHGVYLGEVGYTFKGTPYRFVPGDAPPLGESPTGVEMAAFTAPNIVTTFEGDAIVVDEGEGRLVVTRVRPDGAAAWQRVLPGNCHLTRAFPDLLVVATTQASHRAVGLDLATGKLRWRVSP